MMHCKRMPCPDIFVRCLSAVVAVVFSFTVVFSPSVFAQSLPLLQLPSPGTMLAQTPGLSPTLIKGVLIDPQNPLAFDFIIDTGDSKLESDALSQETLYLIKYFLAALTVPEEEMWVNLSPYEEGRIIPDVFGRTAMGMELLAQDYLLKQLTSSLLYPEDATGKNFWQRVQRQAQERFGTDQIPTDSFHKIWIVPDKATVYQKGSGAFVVESRLRVMLEEDYHAMRRARPLGAPEISVDLNNGDPGASRPTALQTQVMKEIILPAIEKEVNEGETFVKLRQIYQSMILATWFKQNLKESLLGRVYVNRRKIQGVDSTDPFLKEGLYQRYLEAFQKGVFDYIKEDVDAASGEVIPRHYFSGGLTVDPRRALNVIDGDGDAAMLTMREQAIVDQGLGAKGRVFRVRSNLLENTTSQSLALSYRSQDQDFAMLSEGEFAAMLMPGEDTEYYYGLYQKALQIGRRILEQQEHFSRLRLSEHLEQFVDFKMIEQWRRRKSRAIERRNRIWEEINFALDDAHPAVAGFRRRHPQLLAGVPVDMAMLAGRESGTRNEAADVNARIRELHPGFPDLADEELVSALFHTMMASSFLVNDIALEAILAELDGNAQTALGKGGLGYLEGESLGAYENGIGVLLKYKYTKSGEEIDWGNETSVHPVTMQNEVGQVVPMTFDVELGEYEETRPDGSKEIKKRIFKTEVSWINRKGTPVFLLYNEQICNELYPDPEAGSQRMLQYGFIAKAYVELMNRLAIHPDILRLNEAQLVFVQKAVENDIAAKGAKSVFWKTRTVMTNHTPERAALPTFRQDREWLRGLLGSDLIDDDMYRDHNGNGFFENGNPVIRAAEVLARKAFVITTVSEEHGEVTKRHVLRDFAWKTTYVQNGSDPEQWHSALLNAAIAEKGFDTITGEDLFAIGQEQKKALNAWLGNHKSLEGAPYKTFTDLSRPLFGGVRRLVEYKEQGIFIAMVHWITGDTDKLYDTPWGQQYGLGANLLIGGPISDQIGWQWAEVYRSLQNDISLQGKLVFIDRTGTEIMGLADSACDFWLESPRPTREASGTSHQRAMFNGKPPLASYTGGQLSVLRHGINGWLIDVFKTGGFTQWFDELADALDSPSHPAYAEKVEEYRVGAQRLYGLYMTEAVDLYRRYQESGDRKLLEMMEAAFYDSHEKVTIDRMMGDLQKVFTHVMDGTGAAGYESGQIAATRDAQRLQSVVGSVTSRYQLDQQAGTMTSFLMGHGSAMDVVHTMQAVHDLEERGAEPATIALWLLAAYNLSPSFFDDLVGFVSGKKKDLQVLNRIEQLEAIRQDAQDLRKVIQSERQLRWFDEQRRQGRSFQPDLQHNMRRDLRNAWTSLEKRQSVRADAAMLVTTKITHGAVKIYQRIMNWEMQNTLLRQEITQLEKERDQLVVADNGNASKIVLLNQRIARGREIVMANEARLVVAYKSIGNRLGRNGHFARGLVKLYRGNGKHNGKGKSTTASSGNGDNGDTAMLANVTVNGLPFAGAELLKENDVIAFSGAGVREEIVVFRHFGKNLFVIFGSPGTGIRSNLRVTESLLEDFLIPANDLLAQGQTHEFRKMFVQFMEGLDWKAPASILALQQTGGDGAMLTGVGLQQDNGVGGIDLNSSFLDLRIKRDAQGVPLPLPQQPLDAFLNIEGFLPVIIEIVPVQSLPAFLGLSTGENRPEAAKLSLK